MLAALLSSLALVSPQSAEPVCSGRLRTEVRTPSPLEIAVSTRRAFGFRADRAYVRRVQRTGRKDRLTDVAFTLAEWRYLRMRERIQHGGGRVDAYLDAHPDLSGGTSIEDDWPRGPYLLVRLTRDQALHEAALKELYRHPQHLRTVPVEHSERALRALQDSIDFDGAAADGLHVSSTSVDIDRNRVVVDLMTERTDHAAYFRERYGPLVITRVIAKQPSRLACTPARGYRLSRDGRTLRILYHSGGGAEFERVELAQDRRRVRAGIVEDVPNGVRTADLRYESHTVRLRRPLGARRVVDAATGRTLRRVRCAQLLDCFRKLDR